jgi:hypothetical protein
MYKLTDRRFAKAKPILDMYRERMLKHRSIDSRALERELRDLWDTGYQEIKDIMLQLLKLYSYRLIAAYYMEETNGTGIVSEFQQPLADFYGVRQIGGKDFKETRKKFWDRAFALENLSDEQKKDVLLRLGSSSDDERASLSKHALQSLESLGLLCHNAGEWDYTEEGEDMFYRLKRPAEEVA